MKKTTIPIKTFKYRAYPQSDKVSRAIEKQVRLHAMLYNEAKEQRDKNHEERQAIMKNNVLTLLEKEDDFEKRKMLNGYIDFVNTDAEIRNSYEKIKETWKREGIKQKEKKEIVDEIQKEIKELKKEKRACKKDADETKKHIKKTMEGTREEIISISKNDINLKEYHKYLKIKQKIKIEKTRKNNEKVIVLQREAREIKDLADKNEAYLNQMIKDKSGLSVLTRSIGFYDQYALIKDQKHKYKEGVAIALQQTLKRLEDSYNAFFDRCAKGGTPGFPKFKSWKRWDTIIYRQSGWKIRGNKIKLSKIGWFRLKLHRPYSGRIKTVSLTIDCGKHYINFSCENYDSIEDIPMTGKELGIDLGIKNYIAGHDGITYKYPMFLVKAQKQLRVLNRKLSRQDKTSKRRKRTKANIGRVHFHIKHKRNTFIDKIVFELVNLYDVFYVEELNIKSMLEEKYRIGGKYLRKMISDASWGSFIIKLQNKCKEVGKQVILINPHNTTQTCCMCGEIKRGDEALTLKHRVFRCNKCGYVEDRDINAAKVVYKIGYDILHSKEPIK